MSRRRVVALTSAGLILLLGVIAVIVLVSVTQTNLGRSWMRRNVTALINARLNGRGTVYLGAVSGSFFTQLVIDSVAIRDEEDSLFVSTGRVRLDYDPRDLIDRRLHISRLEVEHPFVNIRRHNDQAWNFKRIFQAHAGSAEPASARPAVAEERSFGDFILVDSLIMHDGRVALTMPWQPDEWLHGARRDSAIAAELASDDHEVRRTSEGLKRTWRWTGLEFRSPHVRLADPDSAGRLIVIGQARVREVDPPLDVRQMAGQVRVLGDTVWIDLTHFDFPASTGHASGTIKWGGDLPTRYAVHVVGDSVSLKDVHWVYATLPTTGGGTMELDIHNDPRDLDVLEYALSKMDVRSTGSHLTGAMTFATGKPVLAVTNVALDAKPVTFDFLRTLHGGAFPVDWRGAITGTVRAPGGPLDHFRVNDTRFVFRDANVPGATTRGTARGGLDIQFPARTVFHGFDVDVSTLDLRSIEQLFPSFPRLGGTISGSAVLDSSWLDVRFSHADITHHDGADVPTHATGSGRITYDPAFLTFDLDMQADPLSFTTLAHSYPALRLRGPYIGPVRVQGTMENMALSGTLHGAAGAMSMAGTFDFDAPSLLARASGSVQQLDLSALADRPALPRTQLTGSFTSDLRGDSLGNLVGRLGVDVQHSRVDSTALSSATARLAFAGGRMYVDSLRVDGDGVGLLASGALGLTPAVSDTLRYRADVNWLGALRPYLPLKLTARDSLDGRVTAAGTLVGTIDHLATTGTLSGTNLAMGATTAHRLSGFFDVTELPRSFHGTVVASLDTVVAGGMHLADATAGLTMNDRAHGRLSLSVVSDSMPASGRFRAAGNMTIGRDSAAVHVAVDTLGLTMGDRAWALAGPTSIVMDSTTLVVDSLVLRNGEGGRFALRGQFPTHGPVSASVTADRIPLADVGTLMQSETALGGFASGGVGVAGTRVSPTMEFDARFDSTRFGQLRLPFFTARGSYANRRLQGAAQLFRALARDSQPVLTATGVLPVDLSLHRVDSRLLPDPITGELRADSVDLGILGAISSEFSHPTGLASANVDIGGQWGHPTVSGRLVVSRGASDLPRAGIRLRRVNADISFVRDSIYLRRFSAVSGSDAGDSLSLIGAVRMSDYASPKDAAFDLTLNARNFEAFDQRSLTKLQLTGGLRLTGGLDDARLQGGMTVDRGAVYLPELGQKNIVALDESDPYVYVYVDTTFGRNRGLVPHVPPLVKEFMTHLQVPDLRIRIGDDVWLRSDEANIKLGGSVELARQGGQRLSGTLQVIRGTYRLDLGLVQRTFQVDSGNVVFYGDPEIPPTLNVYASYTVRQVNRQDVHVIAHVGGTLANPQLAGLTTTEQFELSQTEILSYLAFGAPTFALGGPNAASALRPVASALLPTIGGVIERALADQIGILDYVQVQTGSVGTETSDQTALGILSGSRIGIGKQVGERTFVTANYGLCKFSGTSNQSLTDALGVTVERRLDHGFSVQASAEPASTALLCGQADARETPRQFGFDLFREWSF